MAANASNRLLRWSTAVALGVSVVTLTSGCAVWRIAQSMQLARASEPLNVAPAAPGASLLVVGDSTAVGTGASSPNTSVAGLLARDYPRLRIVNRARNGAKTQDLIDQLTNDEKFDAVLIMVGGNDVIRFVSQAAIREHLNRATALAHSLSRTVILMPAGNVGNSPFFFVPWSNLMTSRARTMHQTVREIAALAGITYVNLFKEKADDLFAQQPGLFHAADGLHPSDAGYALWYQELLHQSGLTTVFQQARPIGRTLAMSTRRSSLRAVVGSLAR